jgi:8-oxo-dGTP pyrophosphatase MutT (NUDIX family)
MKKILFHDEVRTVKELVDKITSLEDAPELNDVKIGVICFIFDKDGKVVLNRRGAGARDDVGKLQALGGSINDTDPDDFRKSMMRELKEEAGVDDVSIDSFVGCIVDTKYDKSAMKVIDWVILAYVGHVGEQELKNMEPERCVGIEHLDINAINNDELGETAASFLEYIKEKGIR